MIQSNIFLFFMEDKDFACLRPVFLGLQKAGTSCHFSKLSKSDVCNAKKSSAIEDLFLSQKNPVSVIATRETAEYIFSIKPRKEQVCIYLEHGIAPFKKYSYARHYRKYNYFLAPTKLLRDRLSRLFPEHASKFILSGYPRVDELSQLMHRRKEIKGLLKAFYFPGTQNQCRKLVIFSWGVSKDTVESLPDVPGVAYLLHPATKSEVYRSRRFKFANIFLSTPEIVADLFSCADVVIGDISSLTMEAEVLGLKVVWLVDRHLYVERADLPDNFFDKASKHYLEVPSTGIKLDPDLVISAKDLRSILTSNLEEIFLRFPDRRCLPSDAYPSRAEFNVAVVVDQILKISGNQASLEGPKQEELGRTPPGNKTFDSSMAVQLAYLISFGRNPDTIGLQSYQKAVDSFAPSCVEEYAFLIKSMISEMLSSPEAQDKFERGYGIPLLREAILNLQK